MSFGLIERLGEHARDRPDAPALAAIDTGKVWTWRDVGGATASVARRLKSNASRGTVMLCAANEPGFVAGFLGALAAGWQVFPVSPQSPAAELRSLALTAGATAVIGNAVALDALGDGRMAIDLLTVRPEERGGPASGAIDFSKSALLLHSSGSTGAPKIVRRSAAALDAMSGSICRGLEWSDKDHVLAAAPLCHSYGLEHGLLAAVWAGACAHLCQSFDATTVSPALRESVTIFPGVPFMFELLGQTGGGGTRLRLAYSAGGPLGRVAAVAFENRFGVAVGQVYGATEIGSVTFSDPRSRSFNPSSVGRPLENVSIRIEPTTSEVLVRAPSMFDGYVAERPGESPITAEGYYRTGDIGQMDDAGNLILTGRLKLMIDIGGRKVNPLEVESVLADHPAVGQCVVVPLKVGEGVTRLKALVTPRIAGNEPMPGELRQFVKQRLAGYKVPREFEVRRELPCSAAGKVLREQVRG
jgi:acyl-CoA synthetase (AMP-forming)/AMP-acid ligase II